MTEQTDFSYAKTLQNTIKQNDIMRMAHGVIQANVSKPNVVKSNIKSIREKLAEAKVNSFQATRNKMSELQEVISKTKSVIACAEASRQSQEKAGA